MKFSLREIRGIFPIKLRNFKLWKMTKLLNFRFPEGWYFSNFGNTEQKRSSKIFFSVSERHRWAIESLFRRQKKIRMNKSYDFLYTWLFSVNSFCRHRRGLNPFRTYKKYLLSTSSSKRRRKQLISMVCSQRLSFREFLFILCKLCRGSGTPMKVFFLSFFLGDIWPPWFSD